MIGIIEEQARAAVTAYFDGGDHLEAMAKLRDKLAALDADREGSEGVVDQARAIYCETNENIQVDEPVFLSETDEGTWVAAWLFVPNAEEEDDEDQDG